MPFKDNDGKIIRKGDIVCDCSGTEGRVVKTTSDYINERPFREVDVKEE